MADSPLVLRETWVARVLRALKLVEVRPDGTTSHVAGADYADGRARTPGYKAINSMSAIAAFPWVQASVDAVASDLSMLPLKVTKGRGKAAEPVDDHPVLDLLDRPTSRMSGILLRRQLITDLVLVGDAFLLVAGSPDPAALIRLHPERVRVIPSADGQAAAYEYDESGKVVRYGWEQVLHIRTPSWEDGPRGLYGNGAIRALDRDLTTELKAAQLAANSADTGRPTGIFSPSEEGDRWNAQQVKVMRDAFEKQMASTGGALFLGGPVDYQALGWSPRDMEYQATRNLSREAVLASIGVPPTRVGLPSANYATAREQARRYWEGLKGRAMLVDDALTRLGRMFRDSDMVTVRHDFSEVDALQESRDARVNRVQSWWMMGIPLSEAAAIEGFTEITQDTVPEPEPAPEPEAEGRRFDPLAKWLVLDGDAGEPAPSGPYQAPKTESDRDALWRSFIEKAHQPNERRMLLHMRRYLRASGARISKRLGDELGTKGGTVPVKRQLDDVALDKILDEVAEREQILDIFRPLFRSMMADAIEAASRTLPVGTQLTEDRVEQMALARVGEMVTQIQATTRIQVRAAVVGGLKDGQAISQIQRSLLQSTTFSPMRALRIARTETTATMNRGTVASMQDAEDQGVQLQKEWVSSRDSSVRDTHRDLDGDRVAVGDVFRSPSGATGNGPGEMGSAGENVNCRCVVVPFVEGVS
ncbi:MAG: phage portal protein [Planctomycetota bacterium]|nr:phage portal protein [Planctomycetota bacterium]